MSAGSRRSERCRRGRREPVQSCVVVQFKGVGRSVHGRVVHGLWFERCTDAQSSSVKAAAGGTTRRQATAAPAALPPSSTACCRETSWVERRAARRGMATTTSIAQANFYFMRSVKLAWEKESQRCANALGITGAERHLTSNGLPPPRAVTLVAEPLNHQYLPPPPRLPQPAAPRQTGRGASPP